MGPYCKFCNQRCFTHHPCRGGHLLATCPAGKQFDRQQCGHNIDDVNELITEYIDRHGCDRDTARAKVGVEIMEAELPA